MKRIYCYYVNDKLDKGIRCAWYHSYQELCDDNKINITQQELVNGCISRWSVDGWVMSKDFLNPKVSCLVGALYLAGIQTVLSGDGSSNDLVYVDLHHRYEDMLREVELPSGWFVSQRSVWNMLDVLGLPPCDNLERDIGQQPKVRLTRRGGHINARESFLIAKAIRKVEE